MNNSDSKSVFIGSKLEWALYWHHFGLKIVPLLKAVKRPSNVFRTEEHAYTEQGIKAWWDTNPDSEVGCVGGPKILMLTTRSTEALERLQAIEHKHLAAPLVQITADTATHHLFLLAAPIEALVESSEASGITAAVLHDCVLPSEPGSVKPKGPTTAEKLDDASADFIASLAASRPADPVDVAETETPTCRESTAPIVVPSPAFVADSPDLAHPLTRFSLLGNTKEIEKCLTEPTFVLPGIALRGQGTILYAAPNVGKTLTTLALLMQGIEARSFQPSNLFYCNVDDSAAGLLQKAQLAEQYGFNMLAEGYQDFTASKLLPTIGEITANGKAPASIIVVDTVKRCADLMDKRASRAFTGEIRKFISKGGTFIGLAHVNKKPNDKGQVVYAGTTDMLDDLDGGYTVQEASRDGEYKYILFRNLKKRGPVAEEAAFRYSVEPDLSYLELLSSVERVNDEDLKPLQQTLELRSDHHVIAATESAIRNGINQKMVLAGAVANHLRISKRAALRVIEKYEGEDSSQHRWNYSVQARGAMHYELLPGTPDLPTD